MEFARRRLQLGENLYYKMLEKILVSEQQRIAAAVSSKTVDFSVGFNYYVFMKTECFMLLQSFGILHAISACVI